jgi:hypothetical protein
MNDKLKKANELKDQILSEYSKGNIIVATFQGLQIMPIKDFIEQPTEGMLYDLNRDESTVLTFIYDHKWVNDYAVCQVIRQLKNKIYELEQLTKTKQP